MKKEEGFLGNISAGSGAGNHFFQRPLYHVLKALFRFFIDVMRSDGFAVCPFGDDAADGSGFQSQHGTKCEKGGIFHFIIRTSDMPEIFQRTLQPFQYIAAEAVIPFLSRPEAVGADGNPRPIPLPLRGAQEPYPGRLPQEIRWGRMRGKRRPCGPMPY